MKSSDVTKVKISDDLRARLEGLPDNSRVVWTKEMEQLLLEYWPVKIKKEVAKVLGVSETRARDKYIELTEGDGL